jgi:hypothetical protein
VILIRLLLELKILPSEFDFGPGSAGVMKERLASSSTSDLHTRTTTN